MLENDIKTITKKDAMRIGSKYCREGVQSKTKNIDSVFRASGLWTLYFPYMKHHLNLFKGNCITFSEENPTWMRC